MLDERVHRLEARVSALEAAGTTGHTDSENAELLKHEQESTHKSSYLCARLSLLLVTVAITVASIFTFGPRLDHSYLNHIFIESLYPISLVAWTVHEHLYAGISTETKIKADSTTSELSRVNLCTLDGVHFLFSASTFFLCFSHCIVIYNWPYVVFQGVNGIAALLPFFFLPDLRAALRQNALSTHGSQKAGDIAVTALKRGISILSLMTFLLTEATGCIGLDSPARHVPTSCQYAVIDNFILNHIAFINLFDTVIVETGIVRSRAALIQCRESIPISIRICAAGAAILTIFCIGLFSTRYSLILFEKVENHLNKTVAEVADPFSGEFLPTSVSLIAPLPMLGWMIITTVVFCKMKTYLRMARRNTAAGRIAEEDGAEPTQEMATLSTSALVKNTSSSSYAVESNELE